MKRGSIALATAVAALAGLWAVGWVLAKPVNHTVAMPAADGFIAVAVNGTHGSLLRVPGAQRCVLLMHGIRGDRRTMASRARFLHDAAITSLTIDLQAHGETPGEMITFGYRESRDARNGVEYLRTQGCSTVVAVGQSLGGAAALLGDGPVAADGVGRDQLRPVDAMRKLHVPVLVAGGTKDKQTPTEETLRLFDAAPGKKSLWLVSGAAHEDLYAYDPAQYKARLLAFLDQL